VSGDIATHTFNKKSIAHASKNAGWPTVTATSIATTSITITTSFLRLLLAVIAPQRMVAPW